MGLALDEPKETDETFEVGTLSIVVEKELLQKTGGIKIDFTSNPFGGGFNITSVNPIADDGGGGGDSCGSCSC